MRVRKPMPHGTPSQPPRAGRRRPVAFMLLPVAAACLPSLGHAQAQSNNLSQALSQAASGTSAGTTTSQRQGLVITPIVSAQETFSDNVSLSNTDKQSGFTSQGSAGVRASSNSGRLRGSVDYSLTGTMRPSGPSGSGGDSFTNALNAFLTGELVTNHLFVDLTGNISQSNLSAFGTRSVDTTSNNSNRTEVRSYGISPYLRGLVTPSVGYEVRANGQWTSASAGNAATSSQYGGFAHLGTTQPGLFGWTADATTSTVQYSQGGLTSTADAYKGTLIFNPNPDLSLSLIGGIERNDYLSNGKKSYGDEGVQARWRPSPRTNFSGRFEHRYFGNSHDVNLSYRTQRTGWAYIDTRDVTTSRVPTGGLVTAFTPIYLKAFSDLAEAIPDPVQRDLTVRQILAGIPADATYQYSNLFLTSQIILQRNQALSFTLQGVRDTVTLRLYRTTSSGLRGMSIVNDGLTSSTTVRQTGSSVDLSHRVSASTSASTTFQYLRTSGDRADQLTTLKAVYLSLSARVTPRASLGGGVRHVIFDSATTPYTENAVYVNYSQSF